LSEKLLATVVERLDCEVFSVLPVEAKNNNTTVYTTSALLLVSVRMDKVTIHSQFHNSCKQDSENPAIE
jgi:hypothetical protein